jgi:2,3-bisphosphoglycerate-independent phosphoglycerate mutase
MGAGRVVWQPLEEINRSIEDESFYSNPALLGAVHFCMRNQGRLHLMGLLSDQGIHGTTAHLYALLELARRESLEDVFIHCFLDGRDAPERSARKFLREASRRVEEIGVGRIATVVGRYYAMDRDTNWNRTEKAYDLLTLGIGHEKDDPLEAMTEAYRRGDNTDYYVEPTVINGKDGKPVATIDDGDSLIFWNFRSDRTRQITYALTQPKKKVENNLGQVIASHGLRQLRVAETEKYAQVTFFFNSQEEEANPGEDRIMVPSLKVPSYEDEPVMSAFGVTERLIQEIRKGSYDFILVNYANGDLVGHSANYVAGLIAVETVDSCIGRLVDEALAKDYTVLVTGDHGNIETMLYPDGEPNPSHGLNPVPFILVSDDPELESAELRLGQGLMSVAPTVLDLLGLEKPREMTGESLIIKA